MSRVIATEYPDGFNLQVKIQKSVAGTEPPGFFHRVVIPPGSDPAAVKLILDYDLKTNHNADAIDQASWDAIVGTLVGSLHTADVVTAFKAAVPDYQPLTLTQAQAMIAAQSQPVALQPVSLWRKFWGG